MAAKSVRKEEWNPMQDDYRREDYNTYEYGPGAAMGTPHYKVKPYLVLKNIPKSFTINSVRNLCAQYGKVLDVRHCSRTFYFFVDLGSIADMEAVYRALQNNSYGFHVMVGNMTGKDRINEAKPKIDSKQENVQQIGEQMQLEEHMHIPQVEQHERPHFIKKPIVSAQDYAKHPLLKDNDPQRHFLIEDDAHELERTGLVSYQQQNDNKHQENRICRTGRSYVIIPDDTKKLLMEKNAQSAGNYIADDTTFLCTRKNNGNLKKEGCIQVGKCVTCHGLADAVCGRCGVFYCGIECQKKNWSEHRRACGQPRSSKEKINNVNASQNFEKNGVSQNINSAKVTEVKMPPSGGEVYMTSFGKSNVVFVRPTSYDDNVQFVKMLSYINSVAKTLTSLRQLPKIGQIVLAKFEEQLNRAMVLVVDNPSQIKVVSIDYGNIDVKRLVDLYEAPSNVLKMPRMSIPVVLKDVPDVVLTDEIRNFMKVYVDGIKLQIVYKEEDFIADKGVYCVEMFDTSIAKSFNASLATIICPKEPALNEIYHWNYLKHVPLPIGKNVELVVMENSVNVGYISCTIKEYTIEIQKTQEAIQLYGESLKKQTYTPRLDELCIAKYKVDNKWYRGRCIEVVGNGRPAILFIDYGNIDCVNICDIRKFPQQFMYPIYTSDCEIEGLPEKCNEQQVEMLEMLLPIGGTITCDHVKFNEEDKCFVVTLESVIQKLKL